MVILGATPPGRLTEQHDVFFGIGDSLASLTAVMIASWPEAEGHIHIDSWRKVTAVGNYRVNVVRKSRTDVTDRQLFFLNLGGYKPGDMEEYHYKMLCVGANMAEAVKAARTTAFYRHTGFKGADSHIDDKYSLDIDDAFLVKDVLATGREQYNIVTEWQEDPLQADELHIGYLKLNKVAC